MRSSMRIVSSLVALMMTVPPVLAEEVDSPADAGAVSASSEAGSTSETDAKSEVSEASEAGEANNSDQTSSSVEGDLLPPNAKAGECYARVYTPPVYKTKYEQVLKRAASEFVSVIPPKFETVEETVLVREASKRIEVIPAIYEWEESQVLVKPATTTLKQVPATYETVTERVLEKAGYTYWKKGKGPKQKINNATGEIMCLVEVPPVYRTVSKQIVKTPATVQEVELPAQYLTERKWMMKTPPKTKEVEVPAEYKKVKVTKLAEPAREVRRQIPAEYQRVARAVMVTEAKMEWRSILCETNMTKGTMQKLQRALKIAGYNPGKIDGVLGKETQSAIRKFQTDRRLPSDTYVNLETVKALRVKY